MSQLKQTIRQSFSNASVSYDYAATLQAEAGRCLLRHMMEVNKADVVLDVGCGTGFLTHSLLTRSELIPEQFIALDIALPMLTMARTKLANNVRYVCADAEHLPFVNHAVDWVMSNFALQWCVDLSAAIMEVKRVLKPGGHFIFTIFGKNTLQELKNAWLSVDHYQHVNNFVSVQRLTNALLEVGFNITEITRENHVSWYGSVGELMVELKQLGAQTVMAGRRSQLTPKTKMQQMMHAYQQHNINGLVPATFEVITVVAVVDKC